MNSPPAKRKERSLSSLVVNTPRISIQAGVTGKRKRAGRKGSAPRGASPATEEAPKKEESSVEDHDGSSSPETLNKIMQNKKQVNATLTFSYMSISIELFLPHVFVSYLLKPDKLRPFLYVQTLQYFIYT